MTKLAGYWPRMATDPVRVCSRYDLEMAEDVRSTLVADVSRVNSADR